jgi:hypothetical protein
MAMFEKLKVTFAFLMLALSAPAVALIPLSNEEMSSESGQGLIVAEQLQGANVTSGLGTGDWSNYTYTRMGLDARLSLNANIDKMQLGCGGFNEAIRTNSCDIDMDYVRLMGLSGTGPCAMSTTTTDPCYGGGDFVLTRPYIEIATKGTGVNREVVGVKIGAQNTNGYFGVGRNYANGATNLENGGTCGTSSGAPALACHSGLNSISGYLHTEMSAQVDVNITLFGGETACFGNTTFTNDTCGVADTYYRDLVGTRMAEIRAPSIPLKLSGGFLSFIGISQAYADLTENFRFIHGFALQNTGDFGLSFQRERLAYPGYAKTNASYSYPANAGWWMNVPDVKAVDILGAPVSMSVGQAVTALSEPGVPLSNIELNSVAPDNCWGNSRFC